MSVLSDPEIVRANQSRCGWPSLYYGVVQHFAKAIDAKSILEVGVAYGYHAENLLSGLSEISYTGIDPYLAGYDPNDPFVRDVGALFNEADPQRAMDRLYAAVKQNIEIHGSRARLHRKASVEAAESFGDGTLDLIFIDGDHTYAAVHADLAAWWPKLKPGGIFCGDDYVMPEVKRAVDEFFLGKQLQVQFAAKQGTNYPIWLIKRAS